MKKSYSLLTIHLDRLPMPAKPLCLVTSETVSDVLELGSVYCLFDYPVCRRKLSASKMLQTESLLKLQAIKYLTTEFPALTVLLACPHEDMKMWSDVMEQLLPKS